MIATQTDLAGVIVTTELDLPPMSWVSNLQKMLFDGSSSSLVTVIAREMQMERENRFLIVDARASADTFHRS